MCVCVLGDITIQCVRCRVTSQGGEGTVEKPAQQALPAPPTTTTASSSMERYPPRVSQEGGGGREEDPISALFPDLMLPQQAGSSSSQVPGDTPPYDITTAISPSQMMTWQGDLPSSMNMAPAYSIPPSAPVLATPADTSLEQNAAKAQQMLVEYQQHVAEPPRRKDLNVKFPAGLFPPDKEIDLEGSQQVCSLFNLHDWF